MPRLLFACAVLATLTVAGGARADRVDLMSSDGPMRIEVSRSGEVDGAYPDKDGVMRGRISADGYVKGIWTQPRSDKPCAEVRMGTRYWGTFEIASLYTRTPQGFWGYCHEPATHDWKLRR